VHPLWGCHDGLQQTKPWWTFSICFPAPSFGAPAGDYNPTHTHGGSFSGVIFLKVPPQINANSFDGQLCFHGPEDWHIQSFRTGMAHYVLPVPGEFYVFPAWQPHSVMPFRGDGERWSLAFNVVAAPGVPPTAMQQPAAQQQPLGNVSLSSQRPTAKGF